MPLPRVLEPEVMDTPEEALAYDAMDHAAVNQRFVADLLRTLPDEPEGEWLDLGAGNGLIAIELCKQAPQVRVLAVDLSASMLDLARNHIEMEGLTERIKLDLADAKSLPLNDHRFAGVISNSIVHHIAQPESVWREAVRVAAPGGYLFFRDLLRPESAEQLEQLVQQHAAAESAHARSLFEQSLHAALTLAEVEQITSQLPATQLELAQTSDRHWTWAAAKHSA